MIELFCWCCGSHMELTRGKYGYYIACQSCKNYILLREASMINLRIGSEETLQEGQTMKLFRLNIKIGRITETEIQVFVRNTKLGEKNDKNDV